VRRELERGRVQRRDARVIQNRSLPAASVGAMAATLVVSLAVAWAVVSAVVTRKEQEEG
jgi:hypothetical protein